MTEPYTLTDNHGQRLQVVPSAEGNAAKVHVSDRDAGAYCFVGPLEIPAITAAMYRACGAEPPVMLGRPALPPGGSSAEFGAWRFYRSSDGGTGVSLDGRPWSGAPGAARQVAAWIAAVADAVEAEADPADVEDVAAAIREAFQGDGSPPTDWERRAARAALERMREREAGRD